MVKIFNLTSTFYPFSLNYFLISLGEKFVLNPKTRFVAGAPVGVGSFKPKEKKKGNFIWQEFFFPFNQAMNILGGQESYNTPTLKKCK
jgi:hypothetical protein